MDTALAQAQPPQLIEFITDLLAIIDEQAKAIQALLEENHRALRQNCAMAIKAQSTPLMVQLVGKVISLSQNTIEAIAVKRKELEAAQKGVRYLYEVIKKEGSIQQVNVAPLIEDELKGILHRRALHQLIDEMKKKEGHEQKNMLVLVELDHLKKMQENHGEDMVEMALKHFGHTMRSAIPDQDPIIRYSHETFLIIMHADISGARHSIESIKDQMKRIPMIVPDKNKTLYLHFSGGIAALNLENPHQESIDSAFSALRAAQQSGGNCLKIMTLSDIKK